MIPRKITGQLVEWKNTPNHKALLIKGARQVGKTTTVRQFGKELYRNFVEINFEKSPSARSAFDGDLDSRTVIVNLSAMGYGPFVSGETLLFLDEIQSCPRARTAIKFLVEDSGLDIIESGSLLGINYKDVPSYPVGFEQRMDMFPLDFEEFLWANGVQSSVIDSLRTSYLSQTPVPDFLHNCMMDYFRKFLIVGGMPEAVRTFVGNPDLSSTFTVQNSILNGYRDDISKYAGSEKSKAKLVFDAIPGQLCKRDKRFVLAGLEEGASSRKYSDATQWLADAGVAYFSYNTKAFEIPFSFYEKRNLYKFFLLDCGLLSNICLKGTQFSVLSGDISINEGALTENYVATELVKKSISLNYYDKKSRQELDFVFADRGKISVIEVKSGLSYRSHSSLDTALSDFGDKIGRAIVLSRFNVLKTEDITYFPLYMTMFF